MEDILEDRERSLLRDVDKLGDILVVTELLVLGHTHVESRVLLIGDFGTFGEAKTLLLRSVKSLDDRLGVSEILVFKDAEALAEALVLLTGNETLGTT